MDERGVRYGLRTAALKRAWSRGGVWASESCGSGAVEPGFTCERQNAVQVTLGGRLWIEAALMQVVVPLPTHDAPPEGHHVVEQRQGLRHGPPHGAQFRRPRGRRHLDDGDRDLALGRVSMHGVREALLDAQTEALWLPC